MWSEVNNLTSLGNITAVYESIQLEKFDSRGIRFAVLKPISSLTLNAESEIDDIEVTILK